MERSTAETAVFEVTVGGWFAAAHQLRFADGTVEPLHGHNWQVRVTFRGRKLDSAGLLVDFTRVKARLDELLRTMHDRNLNDLPAFGTRNPSAEHVAVHIASAMAGGWPDGVELSQVEVEEAPGCTARMQFGAR